MIRNEITFKTIFQQSPISTQIFAPNGDTLMVNSAWEKLWGASAREALMYNILKDKQLVETGTMKFIKKGFAGETMYLPAIKYEPPKSVTIKGVVPYKWVSAIMYPVKDEKGKILHLVLQHEDITKEKREEEEKAYQLRIFENISDAVIITNGDWEIQQFNKAAEKLYGIKAKEVIGKKTTQLFTSKFIDSSREESIAALYKMGMWKGITEQTILANKKVIHLLSSVSLIKDRRGTINGIVAVNKDITGLKKTEDALREGEERFRLAIEAGHIGVWDWDIINNKITWSDRIYEIHGVKKKDFTGTVEDYMNLIYEEDRDLVKEALEKSLQDKAPYNMEFRAYGPKRKIIWIITSARVLFDKDGNPTRMLGATIDITQRKHLENQKDEFIGIASHELKTPVTSLKAYGQVLQTVFKKREDVKAVALLQKMDMQINKLAQLISDLLDVTRIEEGKLELNKEHFNFNNLVRDVVEEVGRTTESHTVVFKEGSLSKVIGDRDRYGQVITNLLTNAIKYSPNAKKISITTEIHDNSVICSVKDFGIGIPKDMQQKVFERFFRVDAKNLETYPGLGLGLYISSEIVKRQGGEISVKSTLGKGSTFSFSVPISK